MRFGVMLLPDAPLDEIVERARTVEEAGFDQVFVTDHSRNYEHDGTPWFDATVALSAIAVATSGIRVGTLVSNPVLRPPALLAREAHALDHLSGGRLELGIGTGIAGFDHDAAGLPYWGVKERVERYAEYVAVVDGLLRARGPYEHEGTYFRSSHVPLEPPAPQRPRPPIVAGGSAPTVRRVAAELADCWNTHGPYDLPASEVPGWVAARNAELDRLCESSGRTPESLRRSFLFFGEFDAWRGPDVVSRGVELLRPAGVGEFVVSWPPDARRAELDRVAAALPRLR